MPATASVIPLDDGNLLDDGTLPQRILLVENSRTFTTLLREAIEQRVELPVTVVSTLAEAARVLEEQQGWFLVLTGLVLVDGDRDQVVEFFVSRGLPPSSSAASTTKICAGACCSSRSSTT